jgi:hypothetical protein
MEFLGYVQLKTEKTSISEIVKVYVVAHNIHLDDGSITILKF